MTDALITALLTASNYLRRKHGVVVDLSPLRTVAYFTRVIEQLTRDLYRGDIDENQFQDSMLDLINAQLDRAWNEGMRANGLDPATEMEPEWVEELDAIKVEQLNYVEDFAASIVFAELGDNENGKPGASLPGLYARAQLWVNRYNEVMNLAKLRTAGAKDKLVWRLGATEEHCETCATLNGIVATAAEWDASGYHPQGAPNEKLECGGWRCDCRLEPTRDRLSRRRRAVLGI